MDIKVVDQIVNLSSELKETLSIMEYICNELSEISYLELYRNPNIHIYIKDTSITSTIRDNVLKELLKKSERLELEMKCLIKEE